MNVLLLSLTLVSSPWHFGLDAGWGAGLYGKGLAATKGTYLNPNTHVYVEASRPAIPPPGFFKLGISLEDERSIGIALDLALHYKTYTATGFVDSLDNLYIPGLPNRIDGTQEIPYVHTQLAWGIQKTLSAAEGRVLFPLGLQFTNNWFIPAVNQELVTKYVSTLGSDIPALTAMMSNSTLAIKYFTEHRMGIRLNFGLDVAVVKVKGFSWLAGMGFDWNFLFKKNSNDLGFYPEFGLHSGFRF